MAPAFRSSPLNPPPLERTEPMDSSLIGVIAILVMVAVVIALFIFISGRIRRVAPNEALVVVGRGAGRDARLEDHSQRVVIGGRVFIWPILQQGFAITTRWE